MTKYILGIFIYLITLSCYSIQAQQLQYGAMHTDASIDGATINVDLPTGSTAGESSIMNGAAGYSIPFILPDGTGNIKPKISLNYGSNGGESHFGRGWGLAGLTVISRTGQSTLYDGQVTEMSFNGNDRFVMDGNRMLLTVGIYGNAYSQYVFEAQNFSKITAFGGIGGDPTYFILETKEGIKYEYGNGNNSRNENSAGQAKDWYVSKMIYPDGNYIEYKYKKIHNFSGSSAPLYEHVIDEILYTGNVIAGIMPFAKIKFSYLPKQNSTTNFVRGEEFHRHLLTTTIEITSENSVIRKYEFEYGNRNGVDFLNSITEKAASGESLNSTKFKYGDPPSGNIVHNVTTPFTTTTDYFPCNLDGDGITNLLYAPRTGGGAVYHSQFNGTSDQPFYQSLPETSTVVGVSDNNGDQIDEVAVLRRINREVLIDYDPAGNPNYNYYQLHEFIIYHNNNLTGTLDYHHTSVLPSMADSTLKMNVHLANIYGGDFNGDGLSDYLFINDHQLYVSYGQRSVTQPLMPWVNLSATAGSFTPMNTWTDQVERLYIIDFDGDGKSDIFLINGAQGAVYEFDSANHLQEVFWDDGGSYSLQTRLFDQQFLLFPGDFNGDGKTDFLKKAPENTLWTISYSTGIDFSSTNVTIPTSPDIQQLGFGTYSGELVSVGDYNGDGKSDMFHVGNYVGATFGAIYYSNGTNFMPQIFSAQNGMPYASSISGPSYPGVDGRARVIYRAYSGVDPLELGIGLKSKENLLVKIRNGELHTTIFDYKLMTEKLGVGDNFYIRGNLSDATSKISNVQMPVWLVKDYKIQNGLAADNNYTDVAMKVQNMSYANAKLHRLGKGVLGFAKQCVEDKWSYLRTISYYKFDDQYGIILPDSSLTEFITGDDFVKNENFIQVFPVGTNRYITRALSSTTYNYYENRKTVQDFVTYDAYGNNTQGNIQVYSGANNQLIEHKNVMTQFGAHGSSIPDKPTKVTIHIMRPGQSDYTTIAKMEYNNIGQVTSKKEYFETPNELTTIYEYHPHGGIKKTTKSGPSVPTQILHTAYDNLGRYITEKRNTDNVVVFSATYDIRAGKPESMTDETGQTTITDYDEWGRVLNIQGPAGPSVNKEYRWESQYGIKSERSFGANQPNQKTYFDQMGRKRRTEITGFNGEIIYQDHQYDLIGNLYQSTAPYKSGEAILTTTNTYGTAYTAQRLQSMSSSIAAFGNTSYNYTYDQGYEIITTTAPDGKTSISKIDASGKTVQTTDNAGNVLDMSYYAHGGLKEVKQGNTVLTAIEYDEYNRKKKQTDISAGITQYDYDAYGRLHTETNAKGQVTTMLYDQYDRIMTITRPEGVTTYEYWPAGIQGKAYKLKTVTGHAGDIEDFDYNSKSQITSHKVRIDGYILETITTYDWLDRIETRTLPSGLRLYYEYDAKSYLRRIYNGGTDYVTINEINGRGQITNYTSGNGKQSIHEYYHGIPTRCSTNDLMFDYQMTWDYKNGNLLSRRDQYGNKDTLRYDNLDRLHIWKTTNLIPTTRSDTMMYANNGNILKKTDVGSYTYDAVRIHAVSEITNPDGVIRDPSQVIVYNSFLQPVSIEESIYRLEYTYGSDGNRIKSELKKNDIVVQTKYFLDGYEMITDSTGTYFVQYLGIADKQIAIIHSQNGIHTPHYTYMDHLGSILMVTNAAGNIEAQQNFDPWGRRRSATTWEYIDENLPLGLPIWLYRGYTGHEHLPHFRLINMNGRMYDPEVGRMLSPDNYIQDGGYSQNYNRYSYALNNPLKFTDPDGNVIVPLLISIGVGLLTNGLSNTANDKPFFQGAMRTIGFAIATFGVSVGIGDAAIALALKGADKFVFQAVAHGVAGGLLSALQGGKFIHGFTGGAISSMSASASIKLGALKAGPIPTVLIGGVAGGLAAQLSGGDFFTGFKYGVISSAFNHVAHEGKTDDGGGDPPKVGEKIYQRVGTNGAFFEYTYTTEGWVSKYYPGGSAVQSTDSPLEWGLGLGLKSVKLTTILANKTGFSAIESGKYTLTKTVASKLASRPYLNSPSTISYIMKSGNGVPDAFFKGE